MKKEFLTAKEINDEMEKRKTIRRERLQNKVMKLTNTWEKDDIIHIFSSLICKLTK